MNEPLAQFSSFESNLEVFRESVCSPFPLRLLDIFYSLSFHPDSISDHSSFFKMALKLLWCIFALASVQGPFVAASTTADPPYVTVIHEGSPVGNITELNGVKNYISYPPNKKNDNAILYLPDAFGLALVENKLCVLILVLNTTASPNKSSGLQTQWLAPGTWFSCLITSEEIHYRRTPRESTWGPG
jgi:hypothetical protein